MMEKMKNGEKVIGMQKELVMCLSDSAIGAMSVLHLELATMRRNVCWRFKFAVITNSEL